MTFEGQLTVTRRVLALDPGFANLGCAIVRLAPPGLSIDDSVEYVSVLHTEKETKKTTVFAADDNVRRSRNLYTALEGVYDTYRPLAICAEAMSYPRNAGAAAKMMMAWGLIAALSERHGLPIVQSSPQAIKQVVTGSKVATKEEVQKALDVRFPGAFDLFKKSTARQNYEHGYDAVGAFLACQDSDVIRAIRSI